MRVPCKNHFFLFYGHYTHVFNVDYAEICLKKIFYAPIYAFLEKVHFCYFWRYRQNLSQIQNFYTNPFLSVTVTFVQVRSISLDRFPAPNRGVQKSTSRCSRRKMAVFELFRVSARFSPP